MDPALLLLLRLRQVRRCILLQLYKDVHYELVELLVHLQGLLCRLLQLTQLLRALLLPYLLLQLGDRLLQLRDLSMQVGVVNGLVILKRDLLLRPQHHVLAPLRKHQSLNRLVQALLHLGYRTN